MTTKHHVIVSDIDLGKVYYELVASHADPANPWRPWNKLAPWEQDRERRMAYRTAEECWALEHPEAKDWPPEGISVEYAIESMKRRWGTWPR